MTKLIHCFLGLCLIGLFLPLGACTEGQSYDNVPDDLNEEGTVKADTQSVQVVNANEQLRSSSMKGQICKALRASEGWDTAFEENCRKNFEFQVNSFKQSLLYSHTNTGKPITMEMNVHITGKDDMKWDAVLHRIMGNEFVFEWAVTVVNSPVQNIHDYISGIADEAGEYPDWTEGIWKDRIRLVKDYMNLPKVIQDRAEEERQKVEENMRESKPGSTDTVFTDNESGTGLCEIIKDGQVVGYVVGLVYVIDDPLFDGGGTILYFDSFGNLVDSQEWWG